MHSSKAKLFRSLVTIGLAASLYNCSGSSQNASPQVDQARGGASGNQNGGAAIQDYPSAYCQNIRNVKLRTDISTSLNFICDGNSPSSDMLEFRDKALSRGNGTIQLVNLKSEHDSSIDYSEFLIAWSFHVPLKPFDVKNRPLYDYVASGYTSDEITLAVTTEKQSDATLDSEQHLWSINMSYDLSIRGTANRFLTSQRNTQFNLYQVVDGNEEMGLSVESLIDNNNPDYDISTMVNFSFSDGSGGTIVITTLHFVMNNQGFPETATSSIQTIAQHTADVMYKGLTQ